MSMQIDPQGEESASNQRVMLLAPQPFYEDRGTPIAIVHLLEALVELDYVVDLLTFPVGRELRIPGVEVYRAENWLGFKQVPIGLSFSKIVLDLALLKLFRQRLRTESYAAIHAVEEGAYLAVIFGRNQGANIVYDMQSSLPEQLTKYAVLRPRAIQYCLRRIEAWVLRRVDSVACSVGLERHVRSVSPELSVHEWHFPSLRSPSTAEELQGLRRSLQIPEDSRVALYAGTFEEYQGISLVVGAIPAIVREVPGCHVVLVGARNDAEIALTRERLGAIPEGRVHIVLRRPRDEIHLYLGIADLLISPRLYGKNLPLKIFDYMATGKPIVATAIETHLKILDESRAVLVEPTPHHLASEIVGLLQDRQRMQNLAATALTYAEERLTWTGYLELVEQIYGQP